MVGFCYTRNMADVSNFIVCETFYDGKFLTKVDSSSLNCSFVNHPERNLSPSVLGLGSVTCTEDSFFLF